MEVVTNFQRRFGIFLLNAVDFKSAATVTQTITGSVNPGAFKLDLKTGEVKPVADTSKRESGVFGWMLECAQTGVFRDAIDIFGRAGQIYNRVTFDAATEGLDPDMIERLKS